VAVMRDGVVQQVDVPQRLYESPANLFVAAFIGSPAMNLAEAKLVDDSVEVAKLRIPLDRERRPGTVLDGRVVLGIRPEAFEDAAFAEAGLPQIDVRVEVVEELGSDAFVFFGLDTQPIVVEVAVSTADEESSLLARDVSALFSARVDPRTTARVGETLRLAVDPSRFHFFEPETGAQLLRNGSSPRADADGRTVPAA
jgi:multiple sugar transport system ATP-binding protein